MNAREQAALIRRARKVIANLRTGNMKFRDLGLFVTDIELLIAGLGPTHAENMIECETCDGSGYVEARCNGCGAVLTLRNIAVLFGTEGDDVCKKCQKDDDEFNATLDKKYGGNRCRK